MVLHLCDDLDSDCESVKMTMLFTHGELGCHSHIHWRWLVRQSVLPLVLHHSCYNVVRTLHWSFCALHLGIGWLYHRSTACLFHLIPSRSMRHCVWIRSDGISCQAFQYVRWFCFASTLHNEVWVKGWPIRCSVEWLWSYCCYFSLLHGILYSAFIIR